LAAWVDVADDAQCCDDTDVNDAYNDARYGRHAKEGDEVPADVALHVDEEASEDVVVPELMRKNPRTGMYMRLGIFSYNTGCKSYTSLNYYLSIISD
jgi:hypothetical protein